MTEADVAAVTRTAVLEHLAAFNDHDTERLLCGLDENVLWATGADVYRGRAALTGVFDQGLWDLGPRLAPSRLIVEGDNAAMECAEHMVVEGRPVTFPIAVFVTVRDGLIATVRVFREGSADIPSGEG